MSAWVVIGILAPWFAGAAIVYRRRSGLAGTLLALGGGWLLGQVFLTLLLYVAFRATGASHAAAISIVLIGGGIFAIAWNFLRHKTAKLPPEILSSRRESAHRTPSRLIMVVLTVLFVASIGAKLFAIIPGQKDVPIRNDDAITFWFYKAKVITGSDHLSFDPKDPYYLGGSDPHYPVFLPLSAAYLPLLKGGWSEWLAALPWLGFFLAMPLTILGAIRLRTGAWTPALIAAYVVISLPLVSVHAYRPGYADLPLAAYLAAAVAFVLVSQTEGRRVYGIACALLMLVGAALMKREGPVLAGAVGVVMLLPELWGLIKSGAKRPAWLVGGVLVAIAVVLLTVDVRDVLHNVASLEVHGEVFPSLVNHAFVWASFDLAFWLLPIAIIFIVIARRAEMRTRAIVLAVVLLGIDVCIFALTPQYRFALNDQTPSRLYLQVLPAIIVALSLPVTTGLLGLGGGASPKPATTNP